jgi:hypothetical protein
MEKLGQEKENDSLGKKTKADAMTMIKLDNLGLWQMILNPFQYNISANRILSSSYLFWAGKRLWITCNYPTVLKEKNMEIQKEYNLRYLFAKVRTT